jgi:hypothetical protein
LRDCRHSDDDTLPGAAIQIQTSTVAIFPERYSRDLRPISIIGFAHGLTVPGDPRETVLEFEP